MKSGRKTFILIEMVLLVMVLLLITDMLREKNGKDMEKVSVIIENSNDNQWAAFKYGLKMAATDCEIELSFVSTEGTLTVEAQQNLIENEISNGADAVIVQAVPGADEEEMLKKIQKKIPVILVGFGLSDGEETPVIPVVTPDNYEMGVVLAEELLKDYNGNLGGKKIGILSGNQESQAVADREQGFRQGMKGTGVVISWSVSDSMEQEESLEALSKVDFVVALDDKSLITAGESVSTNDLHGALIYGMGNSTEAVYYLDTGFVECLVVPDEFNVGYQALQTVAEGLRISMYKMQSQNVSYAVIRRESLFSEENQEILFTMSQ